MFKAKENEAVSVRTGKELDVYISMHFDSLVIASMSSIRVVHRHVNFFSFCFNIDTHVVCEDQTMITKSVLLRLWNARFYNEKPIKRSRLGLWAISSSRSFWCRKRKLNGMDMDQEALTKSWVENIDMLLPAFLLSTLTLGVHPNV